MKTERGTALGPPLNSLLLAAGIGTAALGLLALLGWFMRWPLLASFGANLIPMAPSTAVLFLLYGVAVSLRARTPLSGRAFQFGVTAGFLGMLVALLLFVLGYLDIQWSGEHLGLNITGTFQGSQLGYMSPVTAFVFLFAGLSFLASLSRSVIRPWRTALALGSAVVLLGTCFVFLLAYLYGAPLLYGGALIPPALTTILAFTMLGLALLILAGRAAGEPDGPRGADSRTGFALLLIFLLLAMGIIAAGYTNYRHYEKRFRTEVEDQLSAIADLKVGELVQWRRERTGDTDILFRNAAFSALVRRFLEKSEDAEAQRQLHEWLNKYQAQYQYDQACLLDAQNLSRLAAPVTPEPVAALIARQATESLRSGQVTLQDFYRDEHDQRVYLALLVPILDESDANRPLGVLVLRIDPAIYLYPFIKRWPTAGRTTETLLVRREGNTAVFLNELRFQTNTALNLRAPLDRVAMPAVQAALGREGIMDGIDYRGVPVMAILRTIPDSPWSLVARMDAAEVYAPMREQLWQVAIVVGFLLLGAGGCVGLVWRQQRVRFYKDRAEAGDVLLASELRYRRLFESAKDGILILDAVTGMVVDVNPFLIQLLGFSRAAFLGKKIWELGFFKDIVANQDSFAELQQQQYIRYEDKPLKAADGRRIDVEFVSNVYLVDHQKVIQCNIRDISARKQAEAALRRGEQEFRSLAESMPQIVWVTRPDGWNIYFNQQWVDYTGLTLEQSYGHGWNTPFHPDDKQRAWDAWQRATQHDDTYSVECRLRRADGAYRWWLIRGVPLRNANGEILKWFGTCTDIDDIKLAEETLARSISLLQATFESTADGLLVVDSTDRIVQFNRKFAEMWRLPADMLAARDDSRAIAFVLDQLKDPGSFVGKVKALYAQPDAVSFDVLEFKDGRVFERYSQPQTVGGKGVGRVWSFRDITERTRAEAEHHELQAQLLQSQKLESIGTLAGGVAHEINNPIMGIMNYAQLIVDQLGPDSPVTEYATEIGKETQRVATIVKNLLSFARQDEEPHRSQAELCDIVEDTLSLIRAVMRHDQITLEVNVPADLPKILCHSQQIRQVIMNLLTNARDALNQKYPEHDENKIVRVSAREVVVSEQSSVISNRLSVTGDRLSAEESGLNTEHRTPNTEHPPMAASDRRRPRPRHPGGVARAHF